MPAPRGYLAGRGIYMGKLDKFISGLEEGVNGTLLVASTVLLFVNIILRYFFKASTTWAEEAIRYAIIWVTFFGGSICARNRMHLGIDIFIQMAPFAVGKVLKGTAQLISAFFTGMLTYYSWQLTQLIIQTAQKSPAMLMPMWIVYIAMPLGSAMMTIRFLVAAYQDFTAKPDDGETCEVDLSRL